MIHGDEGKVRLWSNVHITAHLLKVNSANFVHHVVDLAHVDYEGVFNGLSVVKFEFF